MSSSVGGKDSDERMKGKKDAQAEKNPYQAATSEGTATNAIHSRSSPLFAFMADAGTLSVAAVLFIYVILILTSDLPPPIVIGMWSWSFHSWMAFLSFGGLLSASVANLATRNQPSHRLASYFIAVIVFGITLFISKGFGMWVS